MTDLNIKFPRIAAADVAYGDRAAKHHVSAKYAIVIYGVQVATCRRMDGGGFMDVGAWRIQVHAPTFTQNPRRFRSLRDLKEWVRSRAPIAAALGAFIAGLAIDDADPFGAVEALDTTDTFALVPFIAAADRTRLIAACTFIATRLHAGGGCDDDLLGLLADLPGMSDDDLADLVTDLIDPVVGDGPQWDRVFRMTAAILIGARTAE